jgi:hypothetical protein
MVHSLYGSSEFQESANRQHSWEQLLAQDLEVVNLVGSTSLFNGTETVILKIEFRGTRPFLFHSRLIVIVLVQRSQ